jgi:mannitol/fructose-specific phosphotransferase system IIA component (Ntr-type)
MVVAESGIGIPQETLREKLFEREQTMSTGIGNAVGVPHTLVEGITGLHAYVVTLEKPISFDAVDSEPVVVVIGLFGDPETPNLSLGALATLGRILRDERFVQSLWKAPTKEEVYRLLSEKEQKKES